MLPSHLRLRQRLVAAGWIAGLLGATSLAAQAEGLSPDRLASRWATRWQVDTVSALAGPGMAPTARPIAMRLFSDYYLDSLRFGDGGGLRVTSGVLAGSRSRLLGSASSTLGGDSASFVTWPYLGVGYSGASWKSGWGVSADLGLAAQNPAGLRLGTRLDDAWQQMRLQPLLQVEVSYRF